MDKKLTPPSPEYQAAVTEWARQINSGEYHAGYWNWYKNDVLIGSLPAFRLGNVYRFEPAEQHPHYAIFKEWETHKNSGAVERGEYVLSSWSDKRVYDPSTHSEFIEDINPAWAIDYAFKILKTAKHPDNCKPKLKMLDWCNAPVGTITNRGEILFIVPPAFATVKLNMRIDVVALSELRILPATTWTAVQDGEEPPVCDGLVIEYRYMAIIYSGIHAKYPIAAVTKTATQAGINAYRVTGIAEGWTDVPETAVQS